jgi:KDO2-lipid IV(A) lauroyltransferase
MSSLLPRYNARLLQGAVIVLILIIKLFAYLPLPVVRGLGWLVGGLLYLLPNRERRNADINLHLVFPALSPREHNRLLHRVLCENARTFLEMPAAWARPGEFWMRHCRIADGGALMRAKLAQGRGVLVAAPHLGNWEVGVHALATTAPATILYRPPRQADLERLIVAGRSRQGATLVPIGPAAIRAMYAALKRGEMVTILPDQEPKPGRGAGVFAPFFGQPALTMTLLSRLARRSGAPVLLTWATREADGGYVLHFREASPAIADADEVTAATTLNADVEAVVRTCAEQYLWTYRRFNSQPDGGAGPYRSG